MAQKNQHILTGKDGETLAVNFIEKKDYTLLERNWRFKRSEVDIIAGKNNVLHFFEVKTRTGRQQLLPEASVGIKKMDKLKEAAQEYLYQYPTWKFLQFNILAITMYKEREPEILLIEDVF